MVTPMFISASQNTTLKASLALYISSNGGLQLFTQGCVYANRAESVTNGRGFPPQ